MSFVFNKRFEDKYCIMISVIKMSTSSDRIIFLFRCQRIYAGLLHLRQKRNDINKNKSVKRNCDIEILFMVKKGFQPVSTNYETTLTENIQKPYLLYLYTINIYDFTILYLIGIKPILE